MCSPTASSSVFVLERRSFIHTHVRGCIATHSLTPPYHCPLAPSKSQVQHRCGCSRVSVLLTRELTFTIIIAGTAGLYLLLFFTLTPVLHLLRNSFRISGLVSNGSASLHSANSVCKQWHRRFVCYSSLQRITKEVGRAKVPKCPKTIAIKFMYASRGGNKRQGDKKRNRKCDTRQSCCSRRLIQMAPSCIMSFAGLKRLCEDSKSSRSW